MKRIAEFLKDKGLVQETVNIVLGIVILIGLVLYGTTRSLGSLVIVIFAGAMMNILTGLSYVRKKEKKPLGMSMILLGVIIIMIFAIYFSFLAR